MTTILSPGAAAELLLYAYKYANEAFIERVELRVAQEVGSVTPSELEACTAYLVGVDERVKLRVDQYKEWREKAHAMDRQEVSRYITRKHGSSISMAAMELYLDIH